MNGLVQHKLHKYFHDTPVLQKIHSKYIDRLAYDNWYYGLSSYSNSNYNQASKVFFGTLNKFVGQHLDEFHSYIKNESKYYKTNACFKDVYNNHFYSDILHTTKEKPICIKGRLLGPVFYCDSNLIIRKIDNVSKKSKSNNFYPKVHNLVAVIEEGKLFVIGKKQNCILTPVIFYLTNSVNPSVSTFKTFITQKDLIEKYNLDVYKLKSLALTTTTSLEEALKDPELVKIYNL